MPTIRSATTDGQVKEMREFLHRLTNDLNVALKSVERQEQNYKVAMELIKATTDKTTDEKAADNFANLKTLIIKSADIIDGYYDVISKKLEGHYSALANNGKDYAKFVEDTTQYVENTSEANTNVFESVQKISADVGAPVGEDGLPLLTDDDKTLSMLRKDTFIIKTGWVDVDEKDNKVGGIELGQLSGDGETTEKAFARFTPKRLVFYGEDGVTELGVFSQSKLIIKDAEILGNLMLRGYILDTTIGLAFNWGG